MPLNMDELVAIDIHTHAEEPCDCANPRDDGYMEFQEQASARLSRALEKGEDGGRVVADLNTAYRESFR